MLTIITPAIDPALITSADIAEALPEIPTAKRAGLARQVSAAIVAACFIARSGVGVPTLRQETVSDTFRLKAAQGMLALSRRFVVDITTVVENGVTLETTDFEVSTADGQLFRLSGDDRICWSCGKIVVTYSAGFATVPEDLKLAAIKFVQAEWQQGGRDPLLKSKSIEGVSQYEWWVDPTKESVIPAEVMDLLTSGGYVNRCMVA